MRVFLKKLWQNRKFAVVGTIAALISFVLALSIYVLEKENTTWGALGINLCFAVLTSVSIGVVFNILLKDGLSEAIKKVVQIEFNKKDNFMEFGLERVYSNPDDFKTEMDNLIKGSDTFYAVLNDGKNWINWHETALQIRFQNKDFKTTFFFLDLEDEALNNVMLKKTGHNDLPEDKNYIRAKFRESIKNLKKLNKKENHLEVYLQPNFNVFSLFLTESTAILQPYTLSSLKSKFPVYIYKKPTDKECSDCDDCNINKEEKKNEYCNLRADMMQLFEDSKRFVLNK